MRKIGVDLVGAVLLLLGAASLSPSFAQNGCTRVVQNGTVISGSPVVWVAPCTLQQAGGSAGSPIVNALPMITDSGVMGKFGILDGPTNGPYHQGLFGWNGSIFELNLNSVGGASTPTGLGISINGATPILVGASTAPFNFSVLAFGADPTGVIDASTAFQNCLNAVGSMGTCSAQGGTYAVGSNITIPANTTLTCGFAFGEEEDSPAKFASVPAIRLAGSATISAGGQAGAIKNCLIYRAGMTFPAADSTLFAGLAVKDNGYGDLQLIDDVIMGFQTCVLITGRRPYVVHVNMDCQGSGTAGTNGAAFELDNANTDGGFIKDIKIQPLSSGNGNCTASHRGNYGLSWNGIDETGGLLVIQNFTTDYIINLGQLYADGTLWSDNVLGCSWGTTTGFQVNSSLSATTLSVNSTVNGIVFGVNSTGGVTHIGRIFLNQLTGKCITMQFGDIHIDTLDATIGTANCASYAIYYPPSSTSAYLTVDRAIIQGVNGGVAPYISSSASPAINMPTFLSIRRLRTDLAAGVNPYSASILWGSGTEPQLAGLNMSVACTGLGSGSCSLTTGSDPLQGVIFMSPTGSPSAAGTDTLLFGGSTPISALNSWECVFTNSNGTGQINQALGYPLSVGVDATHQAVEWNQSGNLTAATTYAIVYHCSVM